jgi:hypothetical protein
MATNDGIGEHTPIDSMFKPLTRHRNPEKDSPTRIIKQIRVNRSQQLTAHQKNNYKAELEPLLKEKYIGFDCEWKPFTWDKAQVKAPWVPSESTAQQ